MSHKLENTCGLLGYGERYGGGGGGGPELSWTAGGGGSELYELGGSPRSTPRSSNLFSGLNDLHGKLD